MRTSAPPPPAAPPSRCTFSSPPYTSAISPSRSQRACLLPLWKIMIWKVPNSVGRLVVTMRFTSAGPSPASGAGTVGHHAAARGGAPSRAARSPASAALSSLEAARSARFSSRRRASSSFRLSSEPAAASIAISGQGGALSVRRNRRVDDLSHQLHQDLSRPSATQLSGVLSGPAAG